MNASCHNACSRSAWTLLTASALLAVSGCKVGPDYTPPEKQAPSAWHNQPANVPASTDTNPVDLAAWWTAFNDPLLTILMERAVAGNLDRKTALAKIRESRARRGIAGADLFPTLNASASGTWTNAADYNGKNRKTTELYNAGFDSGWEIDLFGGTRRSIESADADLQAAHENLHDVLVSLQAELALNYVEVRSYQSRIATVEENIQSQNETCQLTIWRNQAGLTDELAVQQARYNLESTRSQIPSLHTSVEAAMNRIAVLLGETPGTVHAELSETKAIPSASSAIAIGVPADLIRRRPDIRKAERQLASQTAQIGVATADLYPKLKLTGSIGVEALSFHDLARNATTANRYSLSGGPGITWSLFDAGAIRQNIQVQSALQEQAFIQYEFSILNALEEVENALASYVNEQQRMENLRSAAGAAKLAANLAEQEYQAGLTDFNNVLEAQRSLLTFQEQLVQSNSTVTSNLIRLYKALGGGWTSFASLPEQDVLGENYENQ